MTEPVTRAIQFALILVAAGGCATLPRPDPTDPSYVYAWTTEERDPYKIQSRYRSPSMHGWIEQRVEYEVFIRFTEDDDDGLSLWQAYVISRHWDRWHRYDSADLLGGRKLEVTTIDSDVHCDRILGSTACTYVESVGVTLSDDLVREGALGGLELQLSGPGGRFAFTIPTGMFLGLAARIRRVTRYDLAREFRGGPAAEPRGVDHIRIRGAGPDPETLSLPQGGCILWTNDTDETYTVMFTYASATQMIATGIDGWTTNYSLETSLHPGGSRSLCMMRPGRFDYYLSVGGDDRFKAAVEVLPFGAMGPL